LTYSQYWLSGELRCPGMVHQSLSWQTLPEVNSAREMRVGGWKETCRNPSYRPYKLWETREAQNKNQTQGNPV
jgi:hypothetical protein